MRTLLLVSLIALLLLPPPVGSAEDFHGFPTGGHAQMLPGHIYVFPHATHGAHVQPAPTTTYSYGWFGVRRRRHKRVHHGYYNNRLQWSHR